MDSSQRIARNAPCPCNSGKRYKHCHGALASIGPPETPDSAVRELLRNREADELLRQRHQGHGRPIITVRHAGHRFVVIGNRVAYSQDWRFFPDFLFANMRVVIGLDWVRDAVIKMPDHSLLRWLRRLEDARRRFGVDRPIAVVGYISALNRFCYALYLIEHNDKPLKSLLKRLRHPSDFDPACYEAIVASAFALAGAKIDGAEDIKGNQPKPEFIATFEKGQRYSVEAKRKRSWKAVFDLDSEAFATELQSWIRDKLHGASKKLLANPVYWFELGIGEDLTEAQAVRLQSLVGTAVEKAETLTVKGQAAQPAYVVITNNPDFANDNVARITQFALLQGFRMEDFRAGLLDLEIAMERHDKHRPIRYVLECLLQVQQVPNSFDGVPDELLDASGAPLQIPKIGDGIAYLRDDGTEARGRIEEMTGAGQDAYVVIADNESGIRHIARMPLTDALAKASEKFGDAIFGKPEGPRKNTTDPLVLYDRMLEIFRRYPPESLLNQVRGHERIDEFSKLQPADLLIRVAREVTKTVYSLGTERKDTPEIGAKEIP